MDNIITNTIATIGSIGLIALVYFGMTQKDYGPPQSLVYTAPLTPKQICATEKDNPWCTN